MLVSQSWQIKGEASFKLCNVNNPLDMVIIHRGLKIVCSQNSFLK